MEKYYTPDISEFHVGFEYEYLTAKDAWHKAIFEGITVYEDKENLFLSDLKDIVALNEARVKYLDKEDIESLEFELKRSENNNSAYYKITQYRGEDNLCSIVYNEISNWLCVEITINKEGKTIFAGHIKNKSELRRLMQQLSIAEPK